jgi:predicted thioesterase
MLAAIEGRTLEFEVSVEDDAGIVARGRHVRAIVDRARFLDSAAARGRGPGREDAPGDPTDG